jgi:hypothetical protein
MKDEIQQTLYLHMYEERQEHVSRGTRSSHSLTSESLYWKTSWNDDTRAAQDAITCANSSSALAKPHRPPTTPLRLLTLQTPPPASPLTLPLLLSPLLLRLGLPSPPLLRSQLNQQFIYIHAKQTKLVTGVCWHRKIAQAFDAVGIHELDWRVFNQNPSTKKKSSEKCVSSDTQTSQRGELSGFMLGHVFSTIALILLKGSRRTRLFQTPASDTNDS